MTQPDPYDPPFMRPMGDEWLNKGRDFNVCRGRHGGHRFDSRGICKHCDMTIQRFVEAGGLAVLPDGGLVNKRHLEKA